MKNKKEVIHFVITGGTIDSFYNGAKDTVEVLPNSSIPDYIKSLNLYEKVKFTQVVMKDSRALNKNDMRNILSVIEKSRSKKIIVTHGTYSMPDTAKFLKVNLKRKDQMIVFTGSMIPLVGFSPSDAPFNLGYSIAKIQEMEPGVFVCMNGRIFSTEEVIKFLYAGKFTSIFDLK